jgi:hypothetical protein
VICIPPQHKMQGGGTPALAVAAPPRGPRSRAPPSPTPAHLLAVVQALQVVVPEVFALLGIVCLAHALGKVHPNGVASADQGVGRRGRPLRASKRLWQCCWAQTGGEAGCRRVLTFPARRESQSPTPWRLPCRPFAPTAWCPLPSWLTSAPGSKGSKWARALSGLRATSWPPANSLACNDSSGDQAQGLAAICSRHPLRGTPELYRALCSRITNRCPHRCHLCNSGTGTEVCGGQPYPPRRTVWQSDRQD